MTILGSRQKALDLLAHFAPRGVLLRARDLARQFEQDEYVRAYMVRRGLWIAAVAIAVTVASFLATFYLLGKLPIPVSSLAKWQKVAVLLFGVLVWIGSTLTCMHFFLAALQRAALAAQQGDQTSK